jgi:hypothetical protein
MLGRFAGIEIRKLQPSDLNPVKVWTTVEDRAVRTWERAVKYYQSMRLVYDVQTRLDEMNDQSESEKAKKSDQRDGSGSKGTRDQEPRR